MSSEAEITVIGVIFDCQGPMDILINTHDQRLNDVSTPKLVYAMNDIWQ